MAGRRPDKQRLPAPMRDDVRRGDPRAIARLAERDDRTWRVLLELMNANDLCTPALVRGLVAMHSPEDWATNVYRGNGSYDDVMDFGLSFDAWFPQAVVANLAPGDPAVLWFRYQRERDTLSEDSIASARTLVRAIENAGSSPPHRHLLGRALMILARRLVAARRADEAIEVARRAEGLFDGDSSWRSVAQRTHGAALIRLRRLDEALAVLDATPVVFAARERGVFRVAPEADLAEAALAEAAMMVADGPLAPDRWLRALDLVATHTAHRGCIERAAALRERGVVLEVERADDDRPGPFR